MRVLWLSWFFVAVAFCLRCLFVQKTNFQLFTKAEITNLSNSNLQHAGVQQIVQKDNVTFKGYKKILPGGEDFFMVCIDYFCALCLIAACAAARRAIGTRNGEHET